MPHAEKRGAFTYFRDSKKQKNLRLALIYATAQDIPNAVPTAARIADARFHKNLIILDLFSCVITLIF